MKRTVAFIALVEMFITSWSGAAVQLEDAFPMLSFTRPVDLEAPGDGSNRLFVVEQRGVIYVFDNSPTVSTKTVFLDIQDRVNGTAGEEGLLGLAFHPNYADSGYFYVDYSALSPRRSVISRFRVSEANPDSADPASEFVILEVDQPYPNHNGGQLRFGPEGLLWISLGDGGSEGDPDGNGQDPTNLLSSILRIDPDTTQGDLNYGIPPDNPFVGNELGYREEIYAYGLRNPWRFSFDPVTGLIWAGDVGQDAYEEIDIIEKGGNYGWSIMEGFHCYNSGTCDTTGLTLPIWEYGHNDSGGYCITGGFVYRGASLPGLYGQYVYADYVNGRIWALDYDGSGPAVNRELLDTSLYLASFGIDADQELYICAFDGHVYKLRCVAGIGDDPMGCGSAAPLGRNFPNPFHSATTIPVTTSWRGAAELEVVDVMGKHITTLRHACPTDGEYRFHWDGTDGLGRCVAGGQYFYRLTIGGRPSGTGKMVVSK